MTVKTRAFVDFYCGVFNGAATVSREIETLDLKHVKIPQEADVFGFQLSTRDEQGRVVAETPLHVVAQKLVTRENMAEFSQAERQYLDARLQGQASRAVVVVDPKGRLRLHNAGCVVVDRDAKVLWPRPKA